MQMHFYTEGCCRRVPVDTAPILLAAAEFAASRPIMARQRGVDIWYDTRV
jgi:hypothetical protein